MTAQSELKAMKLALQHDKMRREVTESLRWAVDVLAQFHARLPNNEGLRKQYAKAIMSLRTSEAMTSAIDRQPTAP